MGLPVLYFLTGLCRYITRLVFLVYSFCKVIEPSITMLTLPADSPGSFRQEAISSADKSVLLFYLFLFSGFSCIFFHTYWSVKVYCFIIITDDLYLVKIPYCNYFKFSNTAYITYYGDI